MLHDQNKNINIEKIELKIHDDAPFFIANIYEPKLTNSSSILESSQIHNNQQNGLNEIISYKKNLNELLNDTKNGIILFFYPKDNTPGCTLEAKAFSDKLQDFLLLGIKVFGVSANLNNSHEKFLTKQCLTIPLIDDIDFQIAKSYGFYGEKSLFGFKYNSINRCTIFIDKNAKITKIWLDVSVFSHANEVLDFVEKYINK